MCEALRSMFETLGSMCEALRSMFETLGSMCVKHVDPCSLYEGEE